MQIETRTVKNDPELYEYAAYARSECTVQGTTEKSVTRKSKHSKFSAQRVK